MVTARRAGFFYCLLVGCLSLTMTVSVSSAKTLRSPQVNDSGAATIILKIFLEGLWSQPDVRVQSASTLSEFDSNRDGVLSQAELIQAQASTRRRINDIERIRCMFERMLTGNYGQAAASHETSPTGRQTDQFCDPAAAFATGADSEAIPYPQDPAGARPVDRRDSAVAEHALVGRPGRPSRQDRR